MCSCEIPSAFFLGSIKSEWLSNRGTDILHCGEVAMYWRSMDARVRRAFCAAVFVAFSWIALSAQTAGVSQLRMMNGSGLIVAPSLQLPAAPSSAAAADLNGDGNPDLVVTS